MNNTDDTHPALTVRQIGTDCTPSAPASEAIRERPDNIPIPHSATFYNANAADREGLYAEFAPLVRHLVRQYGHDAEMRLDLAGEIYCKFCSLLASYDPERGVPLRPYLVRQLSTRIYVYARQHWRLQSRETGWDPTEGIAEQVMSFDPTQTWIAALAQNQALAFLPVCAAEAAGPAT